MKKKFKLSDPIIIENSISGYFSSNRTKVSIVYEGLGIQNSMSETSSFVSSSISAL